MEPRDRDGNKGEKPDKLPPPHKFRAIESGPHRIEYHPPDMGIAYAELAPLVAEAQAFMECDQVDKARASLTRARKVIEMASQCMAIHAKLTVEQLMDDTEREHPIKIELRLGKMSLHDYEGLLSEESR